MIGRFIGLVVTEMKEQWPYWVIIALLSVLVYSLLGQLEVSRSNEMELGRRLMPFVKSGQTSTNAPNAK